MQIRCRSGKPLMRRGDTAAQSPHHRRPHKTPQKHCRRQPWNHGEHHVLAEEIDSRRASRHDPAEGRHRRQNRVHAVIEFDLNGKILHANAVSFGRWATRSRKSSVNITRCSSTPLSAQPRIQGILGKLGRGDMSRSGRNPIGEAQGSCALGAQWLIRCPRQSRQRSGMAGRDGRSRT